VAAIERLNHALAQLARALASAEENRMDLKEARLGRVRTVRPSGIGSSSICSMYASAFSNTGVCV